MVNTRKMKKSLDLKQKVLLLTKECRVVIEPLKNQSMAKLNDPKPNEAEIFCDELVAKSK